MVKSHSLNQLFDETIQIVNQMKSKQSSIPAVHQQATHMLMQILGMEMEEAFRYLKSMKFNLERAINHKLNPQQSHKGNQYALPYQFSSESEQEPFKPNTLADAIGPALKSNRIKERAQKYVGQKTYNKTYLIKKTKSPKARKVRGKMRDQENDQKMVEQFQFQGALSKLIGGQVNVSFMADIYDTFKKLWEERKLVAIHCLKFQSQNTPQFQQLLDFTRQVYRRAEFVGTFNKYLINFGLDPSHFDFAFYSFMRQFIGEGDQFKLIILRYNQRMEKVELVKKLPFSEAFKFSAPQLFQKEVKQLEKEKNCVGYRGDKMSSSEKERIEEDRLIREQQQIQYYKQMNTAQNQTDKANQSVQAEDIAEARRKRREQLTKYTQNIEDAIDLKVRLPSSEILCFKLPRTQQVQYLFKAIQNHQGDLGFIDEVNRKFDIVVPLQRIQLCHRQSQTFQSIFGKSQMESLAVKQL